MEKLLISTPKSQSSGDRVKEVKIISRPLNLEQAGSPTRPHVTVNTQLTLLDDTDPILSPTKKRSNDKSAKASKLQQ